MTNITVNRKLLFKSIKDFLRKIEQGKKQLKEVNASNVYSLANTFLENEEPEYIEFPITVTKYAFIIDFRNIPINETYIQKNLKFLETDLKAKENSIFGKKIKSVVFYKKKLVVIFWDILYYKDVQQYNEVLPYNYVFYGIDLLTNNLIYEKDTSVLHHNILGATNTGKTVSLINIMASLSNRKVFDEHPNLRPDFLVLEKANDFNIFFPFKNMIYKGNVTNIDNSDIILVFFYLRLLYQERNDIMKKEGNYQNIHEYNNNVPDEKKMNLVFLFIDEFKTLLDRFTGKSKLEFEIKVGTVTQLYRSVGIYLYIGTQNFGADKGVPTSIRGNIRTYLIGHTEDVTQYYRFLKPDGYTTASKIKLGDFILKNPETGTENILRIPYVYSDINNDDDLDKFRDLQSTLKIPLKEEIEENDSLLKEYLTNAEYYGKKTLTNLVESKLVNFGKIKILSKQFLEKAGVDLNDLKIIGLRKIGLIILSNLFDEYISQTQQSLNNKLEPEPLNIENLLDNASEKYPLISFVTMYVRDLYMLYCKGLVDNNINKKINKLGGEDGEEAYQIIEDSLIGIIRITAEKLAQINDDEDYNNDEDYNDNKDYNDNEDYNDDEDYNNDEDYNDNNNEDDNDDYDYNNDDDNDNNQREKESYK